MMVIMRSRKERDIVCVSQSMEMRLRTVNFTSIPIVNFISFLLSLTRTLCRRRYSINVNGMQERERESLNKVAKINDDCHLMKTTTEPYDDDDEE
jgi:hypothetical protein